MIGGLLEYLAGENVVVAKLVSTQLAEDSPAAPVDGIRVGAPAACVPPGWSRPALRKVLTGRWHQ